MQAYLRGRRTDTKFFQSNLEVHIQSEDKPEIENKIETKISKSKPLYGFAIRLVRH